LEEESTAKMRQKTAKTRHLVGVISSELKVQGSGIQGSAKVLAITKIV
jgi:hypothetical protein